MTGFLADLVAVVLTLLVLSRILGDSPLFRIAQYLFVGVSLGYAFVIVYHQVLWPAAAQLSVSTQDPLATTLRIAPFVLGILLLPRVTGQQSFSWLANIPLGLVFGVGAAVALSGALAGTIMPQLLNTALIPQNGTTSEIIGSVLLAIGVILVLSYFYFTLPQQPNLKRVSAVSAILGRWILIIAFGFFFAGTLLTYLTALTDRLEFLISWVRNLL